MMYGQSAHGLIVFTAAVWVLGFVIGLAVGAIVF